MSGKTPHACTKEYLTLKPNVQAKLRQRHYWGSPEWQASFNRRTSVEGSFGILKGRATGPIQGGWTQQRGNLRTLLLLAAVVTATNVQILRKRSRRTGDITDPVTTVDLRDPGFLELEPEEGDGVSGISPPA